jgi:hypothetical protein
MLVYWKYSMLMFYMLAPMQAGRLVTYTKSLFLMRIQMHLVLLILRMLFEQHTLSQHLLLTKHQTFTFAFTDCLSKIQRW